MRSNLAADQPTQSEPGEIDERHNGNPVTTPSLTHRGVTAGEGNRTLVFSLEGEEFCNVENAGSDILQPWG
jgi:hypothetical protein